MSPRRPPLLLLCLGLGVGLTLAPALAPATIEEQRQRLPPPAFDCADDPIAGLWQAHVFYAHVQQWYRFDLSIARDLEDPSGQQLRGTITAEFWDGGPELAQPPGCDEPGERASVFEHAAGEVRNELDLHFEGRDWRDTGACGHPVGGYLLDRFTGRVDPERMEFQSVLNADAPQWRDVPTVFRRVRCAPSAPGAKDEEGPRIVVTPPPYQPPEREGCGFRP